MTPWEQKEVWEHLNQDFYKHAIEISISKLMNFAIRSCHTLLVYRGNFQIFLKSPKIFEISVFIKNFQFFSNFPNFSNFFLTFQFFPDFQCCSKFPNFFKISRLFQISNFFFQIYIFYSKIKKKNSKFKFFFPNFYYFTKFTIFLFSNFFPNFHIVKNFKYFSKFF